MTIRLTAFTRYDRQAASTRQRLLQYVPALRDAGIELDYRPLLNNDYVASLAQDSPYPRSRLAEAYLKRLREVLFGPLGDVVWVYVELFPGLPSVFERLLIRRGSPIVYDFDDAFFHNYDDHSRAVPRTLLGGKLKPLIAAACACTCGNEYLRAYAARYSRNAVIVPTVVDTDKYRPGPAHHHLARPVIGWIGSPSTWSYVRPLCPLLAEICRDHHAVFRVVGAGKAAERDLFPGMELIDWSEESEVAELQRMDIGIMPIPDQPWARGKSGYKLIQYMACGLPMIGSPVGVNCEIVRDGENGFLAGNMNDWREALERLMSDPALRSRLGRRGRDRAVAEYSLEVYAPRLVEIIKSAACESAINAIVSDDSQA